MTTKFNIKEGTTVKTIAMIIILIGALLRMALFLQNRNLILDEASLMLNLKEHSFLGLMKPLNYEQFAPPLFLLISKLGVNTLGYWEFTVRAFPLICGILSLYFLRKVLLLLDLQKSIIYPLFLMATGVIYIRYATEFKQYSSDTMVSIILVYFVLRHHLNNRLNTTYFISLLSIGSISIWLSMPSVFVLAAIVTFHLYNCYKSKNYTIMYRIIIVASIWLLQFSIYYFWLLKPSIHSNYLQNWHKDYFPILLPKNKIEWVHNIDVFSTYFGMMGGHWVISFSCNLFLVIVGFYRLYKANFSVFILFLLPILFLFFASFLHCFTLLPRVTLFSYPLLLCLIGIGLEQIICLIFNGWVKALFYICLLISMYNFNGIKYLFVPLKFECITDDFKWIEKKKKGVDNIFIHDFSYRQWRYYTQVNPNKSRWNSFNNVQPFYWNSNFDTISKFTNGNSFFVYSWVDNSEFNNEKQKLDNRFILIDSVIDHLDHKILEYHCCK